ncbi:MAG TPA: dihydroorotate dehydrogenase-like protein [Mycobacteriales bacterium]|nr:dihydroorotate dehydrogenase-like protein [Mycobacteriales bacterium]
MTNIADRSPTGRGPIGGGPEEQGRDVEFKLSTAYLGLPLRTPIVASSGPLTGRIETLVQLEEAGVGAVVLPSLFEEQVEHDALEAIEVFERAVNSNPEAFEGYFGYFSDVADYETVGQRAIRHVREAKAALTVPVIGSINGTTPGGWTRYAKQIQDAGADALELNLYEVAADAERSSAEIEDAQLALVAQVKQAIGIPLAVKVSPYYTGFAHMARRLADAGADGLVLFNRFYQPDIDVETFDVARTLVLSRPDELRLPLRWIAIVSGQVDASLATTSGVHTGLDVVKCVLAGADVAMMTSALLEHGPTHVTAVQGELVAWAREHAYVSVTQMKGATSRRHVANADAYERANYVETLVRYANTFNSGQGFGPW